MTYVVSVMRDDFYFAVFSTTVLEQAAAVMETLCRAYSLDFGSFEVKISCAKEDK